MKSLIFKNGWISRPTFTTSLDVVDVDSHTTMWTCYYAHHMHIPICVHVFLLYIFPVYQEHILAITDGYLWSLASFTRVIVIFSSAFRPKVCPTPIIPECGPCEKRRKTEDDCGCLKFVCEKEVPNPNPPSECKKQCEKCHTCKWVSKIITLW